MVGVGLVCLGMGCGGRQTPEATLDPPGAALFNGQVHKDVNCARCHGSDGAGGLRGPNLKKRLMGQSDEAVAAAILKGPGFMPPYEGKLSEEEVKQIIAWLRSGATE